jgi:exodeoxyribonuclease VII large subunit
MSEAFQESRTRPGPPVWSVSQLTARIKGLLEDELPFVWVAGEISNLGRPTSGHVYFTLKDERAQIRAVLWNSTRMRLGFEPSDGMRVLVQGRCTIYEGRSQYQLMVDQLVPQGLGALELAFRQLRAKLEKEGLFARERKKPIPRFPRRVVVVTSPTGAAVRDIVQIISRRWKAIEVLVWPVRVQGDGAAHEIVAAITGANRVSGVDVMIVGRGGGSLEDLWAFNEEVVARAIFASRIPIISAVGHEVDWTIADYVADLRAPTPSAAAELLVPHEADIRELLQQTTRRLVGALTERLRTATQQFSQLSARRPFQSPLDGIRRRQQRSDDLAGRLDRAVQQRLRDGHNRVAGIAQLVEGLSPLNVLARGYSLTTRDDGHTVLRDADRVADGDRIVTRLAKGVIASRVESSGAVQGPSGS